MKLMRVDSLIEQGKAPSPLGLTRSSSRLTAWFFLLPELNHLFIE